MAKAMVAVSLASGLLLLFVVGGAVGLGDGGQAWAEGWEDMRQVEVDANNKQVEEVEGKVNNRQGRRLGEAEGIAAYNRVDTPFAVPGLEELDGISPVTKAPRKFSSVNRRIRPVSTSRKINRRPSSSRPSSSRPSSRSFPRFPRPTFHNLPRFPASFPAETPNQPAANPQQAPLPFNPHPQAAVPQAIHPQAAHPQQALHPQAPQGFPALPRNNFFQQGFPQSEGSLPGRSFTGLFDPFRNFFPNFHAPPNGLPQIPERPRSTQPTPSPATTPATTPPWKKKSVRKKGTSGKKRFWVVTDKPEPTTAPTTTQRSTSTRRTTTRTTTRRSTTTKRTTTTRPTTTRRPTTTSTTTTTTRPPVPQEFPRRIAIEQIPVHEYQYEQVEDYDYVHYHDEDEDARHVEPEYVDYPDYSPVPSSCPSSLAECVSSCAPVLAIQQRAYKLCVNECLERCS